MDEPKKKTKYDGNPDEGCTVKMAVIVVIVIIVCYTLLGIAEIIFK